MPSLSFMLLSQPAVLRRLVQTGQQEGDNCHPECLASMFNKHMHEEENLYRIIGSAKGPCKAGEGRWGKRPLTIRYTQHMVSCPNSAYLCMCPCWMSMCQDAAWAVSKGNCMLLTASMAALRGTTREEEAAGAKGLSPSGTHSIWYPVLLALKL